MSFEKIVTMIDEHIALLTKEQLDADEKKTRFLSELCTGGELFDKIIEAGHLTEVHAAITMQQMIRTIFYMHESGVCHRDLKPEHFLLQIIANQLHDTQIKIVIEWSPDASSTGR